MKRILSLILILSVGSTLLAQSDQRGIVLEYNDKQEKTPLPNVEIVVTNAGSTVTDKKGEFTLHFRQLKPGDKVQVRRIEKPGYEVFNQETVDQWRIASDACFTFPTHIGH